MPTEEESLSTQQRHPGSFRDPSGYIFTEGGKIFRAVQPVYQPHYDKLMSSGLYEELTNAGLLVRHEEAPGSHGSYKTLAPDQIPFISYPYEWCFTQYKRAALATLEIAQRALNKGMILKDASAYNIQFLNGAPILLDTLSFETYEDGKPWVAYRQFCEHFLAPLALAAKVDARLSGLMLQFIDGIPLDLAASILKGHIGFNMGLKMHVEMHAKAQKKGEPGAAMPAQARLSKQQFLAMLDNLAGTVKGLTWDPPKSVWSAYYQESTYAESDLKAKESLVSDYISRVNPSSVWDLGANTGRFSRISSRQGIFTMSCDGDSLAVELNQRQAQEEKDKHLLPLRIDLANPTPAIGWANEERDSLAARGPADLVLALALIHHLAIGNNVPFEGIADLMWSYGRHVAMEFVPPTDPQVKRMMADRTRTYDQYNEPEFRKAFQKRFDFIAEEPVAQMGRTLFLLRRKEA